MVSVKRLVNCLTKIGIVLYVLLCAAPSFADRDFKEEYRQEWLRKQDMQSWLIEFGQVPWEKIQHRVQPRTIVFQSYFLKRMLYVMDSSDDVRIAEFDRLIAIPLHQYSAKHLNIDTKNPPDPAQYTQSPYHHLKDEVKYKSQIDPNRFDSIRINDRAEFDLMNSKSHQFLDMDFGIPLTLLAPEEYQRRIEQYAIEIAERKNIPLMRLRELQMKAHKKISNRVGAAYFDAFTEIFLGQYGRPPRSYIGEIGRMREGYVVIVGLPNGQTFGIEFNDYQLFENGKSPGGQSLNDLWNQLKSEKSNAISAEVNDETMDELKKLLGAEFEQCLKSQNEGKDRGRYYFFADLFGLVAAKEGRKNLLKLPKHEKLKIIRDTTEIFETNIRKLQNIANELVLSGDVKFENPADQRFFELLLSEYYNEIPREMAKNVLKKLIEKPEQNSPMDLFRLMVLYSGPQMQKLLQVLGRNEGFSPELRKVFNQLEENGLESPWDRVADKFKEAPLGYEWISLSRQSFVGTMAQTYFGSIRDRNGNSVEVAARILKPGIAEELSNEKPKLENLARKIDQDGLLRKSDFPLITPILRDVEDMAKDELDIELTKNNQRTGEKYNSTIKTKDSFQIDFVTPRTLDSPHDDVLYSTWLKGEKFDSFQEKYPAEASVLAQTIAEKWIETAFFTDLFFHADLHQGNMKILKVSGKHIQVGFLDFGMTGTIDKGSKSILTRLGIELIGKRSARLIADYIWQLSDSSQNLVSYTHFVNEIEIRLGMSKSRSIADWLKWSLSKGIKLQKNINAFSRGLATMEQLLLAGKSQISTGDLILKVAKKYKWDLAKLGVSYLKDQLVRRETHKTSAIPLFGKESAGHKTISCEKIFSSK